MLFFRACSPKASQKPPWLEGMVEVGDKNLRIEQKPGTNERVVFFGEKWRDRPPTEAAWKDCGEHWQVIDWGVWDMWAMLRHTDRLRVTEVADADGHPWPAPVVLHPYPLDALAFDVPLGDGWKEDPTPEQETLIHASRWARDQLLKGIHEDLDEHRIIQQDLEITLPAEMAAQATADLLSAILHVTPEVLQALRVVDKRLMGEVLATAAGLNADLMTRVRQQVEA